MVAEERLTKYRLCRACEPTGTALVVNSCTTARRIDCFRFSISFSTLRPRVPNQVTAEGLAARWFGQGCGAAPVLAEIALRDTAHVLPALLGVRGLRDVVAVVARMSAGCGLLRRRRDRWRRMGGGQFHGKNDVGQDEQRDNRRQNRHRRSQPAQHCHQTIQRRKTRNLSLKNCERYLVVQGQAPSGRNDAAVDFLNQPVTL